MPGGDTKTCAHCKCEFERRTDIRWPESDLDWAGRRFCSRRCGLKSSFADNVPSIASDRPRLRGKLAGLDPRQVATQELLRRCIRYGLNNDSDLGMGYGPFMTRARELGLAA